MGEINSDFLHKRLGLYANAAEKKSGSLTDFVGFIDGKAMRVARPGDNEKQNSMYIGHKGKHALKFQAIVPLMICLFIELVYLRGEDTTGFSSLSQRWMNSWRLY